MEYRRLRAWVSPFVVLICLAGAVNASAQQVGTSTLTGTVADETGGVVPGATANATEAATGLVRSVVTNAQGVFRVPSLPPGKYSLKVELSGFRPVVVTEIALTSSEVRDLGKLILQAGAMAETVTVTANVTPVQVATSSRINTVTSDDLTNIQMKGRDIYGLLAILPGVMDTNLNRDFTTWTSMRDVTINGSPVTSKNVMVDGISVVDEGGTGNAFVNPNIDAVGEAKVIANGYTAENGRNNGGLINFVTKSGTNTFKGSGWYNARRDKWNENDYIRKRQGQAKPLYRVNIGGYSIGGPVIIPKVIDSRASQRKVFFFFSQEYTDDARPSNVVTANLPTDLERSGDFSQTYQTSGTGASAVYSIQPLVNPYPDRTDFFIAPNVINPKYFNSIGQRLLNLVPRPNGYVSPVVGQRYSSNFAFDQTPLHSRTDHVFRADAVLSKSIRMSAKLLADREDNWSNSNFAPGLGVVNNFVPGWVLSGNMTQVLSPTMVNEINAGFGHNNYGFKGDYDYRQYYRSAMGIDPPRLQPFGPYADPPVIGYRQQDQYPYVPITSFGGGTRPNLSGFSPGAVNGRVMPAANRNDRYSFQDDLTITKGRHSYKFGMYVELNSKTEPGSTNYMGNFNFGSVATNPLDTGNGYANALLGIFQTYTETTVRVDKDLRHWQNEGYLQDSWKMTSRFTLDYGVRLTHSGAYYEVNHATAGFYPELYDPAKAPRLYRPYCANGAAGNQACPQNQRFAIDPANPTQLLSFAYVGTFVPGTGDQLNGMKADGRTGKGDYANYPALVAAPRVGFAWDLGGDGKTALRSSFGVFYNFPRSGPGSNAFVGIPPVSFDRVVRNATIEDIANFSSGKLQFSANPINAPIATLKGTTYRLPISYNTNVAFQRDVGFSTVVEIAYVGNFTYHDSRTQNLNPIPLYAYGDPKNLINNTAISANFLRSTYPGLGTTNETYFDQTSLIYHAMQLSVQRRLSKGLQMGLAYTLSKGEGMQGWDEYTAALGDEALRARYWGPTGVDRRHNLVVNYSYLIPNPTRDTPVLKHVLGDWQVSGVTKFLSGTVVNPACSSTGAGIANSDPSLTGIPVRCQLTGLPIDSGFTVDPDPLLALHLNPAAFSMAQPISATVGNFGNAPLGLLRNPSWSNWDITLARRFPVSKLGRNALARLQLQAYNIFNQVQFTTMGATFQYSGTNNSVNNNTNTGKYTAVIPPRQLGVTVRFDF